MNLALKIAQRYLRATDEQLSQSIADALKNQIGSSNPQLGDWDVPATGVRGFRPGYTSFGLKPLSWAGQLPGGLLLMGQYSIDAINPAGKKVKIVSKIFKPGQTNPDLMGVIFSLNLSMGYYNKVFGDRVVDPVSIGTATVEVIDDHENVTIQLDDFAKTQTEINQYVSSTAASLSSKSKGGKPGPVIQKYIPQWANKPQFKSIQDFVNFKNKRGETNFTGTEAAAITLNLGTNLLDVITELEKEGLSEAASTPKSIASELMLLATSIDESKYPSRRMIIDNLNHLILSIAKQ
jgi:hypothetical protein